MASLVRTTPVGVDIIALATLWHIAGVQVDNPTGSWINIPNVGNVPPYTIGWTRSVSPAAINIDVRFQASPSGATSDPTLGGLVVVTIYDHPVADLDGYASGAESQTPGAAQRYLQIYTGAVTVTEIAFGGPDDIMLIAGPIDTIIVPLRLSFHAAIAGSRDIRGLIQASFAYTPPGGFNTEHVTLIIMEGQPTDRYDFLPGELVIPVGSTDLKFSTSVQTGAGDQRVAGVFGYYEIVTV